MNDLSGALARELDVELNGEPSNAPPPAKPGGLRAAMDMAAQSPGGTVPLRAAPVAARPQTIAEQVQQLERIELQIDERIRRGGVEAQCEVESKITAAHASHARQLAEETARLGRERDETIRQATDAYHVKLHELAALLRRRTK
jgi:hypothetical protein